MKPSTARVLALLERRGERGLSPNEAHVLLGCDRLAARVHELRAAGFGIDAARERHGPEGTHARYTLRPAAPVYRGVQTSLNDFPEAAAHLPAAAASRAPSGTTRG